jgi:hypothetical protein
MKKMLLLVVCLAIAGCGPSPSQIAAAIAQTEAARPTATISPTSVPSPTPTPTPTRTRVPSPTPVPAMTVRDAEDLAFARGYLFTDSVDSDGKANRQALRFDITTGITIYGTSADPNDLSLIEMVIVEGWGVPITTHLTEIQWFFQTYGTPEMFAWAMDHIPEFGEDMQVGLFGYGTPACSGVMVAANSADTIVFGIMPTGIAGE